jgi:formamidopyrimidine-DNA glycosylase
MPELPEVETIRRQLERETRGRRINSAEVRFAGRLNVPARTFVRTVAGASVISLRRRAKLLLIGLSNGWTMAVHLKMTGRFLLVPGETKPTKHTHVVFRLSGGKDLFFDDYRKFGFIKLVRSDELEEKIIKKEGYGPEPLEPDFTAERFAACLAGFKNKRIKPTLMDQTCVAGVGNIYADEALWRSRIKPDRRSGSLKKREIAELRRALLKSLNESIRERGTSADSYLDLYGRAGTNAQRLKAYGREGEPCPRCGRRLVRVRLAGRSAHYCPKCQH